MLKYIFIKGLRYKGETWEQAEERERIMEQHNAKADELARRNSLMMSGYREWAKARGLLNNRDK